MNGFRDHDVPEELEDHEVADGNFDSRIWSAHRVKPVRAAQEKSQALILAGGLGNRLRAAYANGPKSLAPVAGRPFLDYLMRWLQVSGFSNVVLCVGYKTEQIRERYQDGQHWGLRISYSVEKEPLGTAGAIKNAEALLQGDAFLVLNGDSFTDVSLGDLVQFHRRRRGLATVTLAPAPEESRYGSVRVNARGEILGFAEKGSAGTRDGKRGRTWINGGVYAFQKDLLRVIPRGRPVSLETEIFPHLIDHQFYGFPTDGYFIDIGVPADYRRAQKQFRGRFPQ
jgi:D-glycero-alpha-D-manno-heptose 1-phosphate guanylyltransferase